MSYTLNNVDANGVLLMVAHADNGDWDGNKASLVNVTIGSAVADLPVWAFKDAAPNLTSVTFNTTNLTQINAQAFSGCTSLVSIEIPEGVEYLQDRCFMNCESLISVTIPSTVIYVSGNNFLNCHADLVIVNHSSYTLSTYHGLTTAQLANVTTGTSASSGDPFVTPMLQ